MAKKGWRKEPARHSLAARGVRTNRPISKGRSPKFARYRDTLDNHIFPAIDDTIEMNKQLKRVFDALPRDVGRWAEKALDQEFYNTQDRAYELMHEIDDLIKEMEGAPEAAGMLKELKREKERMLKEDKKETSYGLFNSYGDKDEDAIWIGKTKISTKDPGVEDITDMFK